MGVLIIDQQVRDEVAKLIERARAKPVTWDKAKGGMLPASMHTVKLTDRKPGYERPPSETLLLGTYQVNFSIEEQPAGMCRHLSISARRAGTLPNIPVIEEILTLFGMQPGLTEGRAGHVWLEEFLPGHHAVNVVQLIGEPREGHA